MLGEIEVTSVEDIMDADIVEFADWLMTLNPTKLISVKKIILSTKSGLNMRLQALTSTKYVQTHLMTEEESISFFSLIVSIGRLLCSIEYKVSIIERVLNMRTPECFKTLKLDNI